VPENPPTLSEEQPEEQPAELPEDAGPAAGEPVAGAAPATSLAELLGTEVRLAEGGAELDITVTSGLTNPLGNLHGGITLAACDLAAQAALLEAGGPTQTASVHVAYPRPMPLGTTPRFEARVLHNGRSLGIVRVTATLDGVKPCAVAMITTGVPG
jgi:uncharacterized protein (TIGR00369 family)